MTKPKKGFPLTLCTVIVFKKLATVWGEWVTLIALHCFLIGYLETKQYIMSPYRADTLCPGWVDKLICIWKLTGETKGLQFEAKNGLKSRVTNTEAVCSNLIHHSALMWCLEHAIILHLALEKPLKSWMNQPFAPILRRIAELQGFDESLIDFKVYLIEKRKCLQSG